MSTRHTRTHTERPHFAVSEGVKCGPGIGDYTLCVFAFFFRATAKISTPCWQGAYRATPFGRLGGGQVWPWDRGVRFFAFFRFFSRDGANLYLCWQGAFSDHPLGRLGGGQMWPWDRESHFLAARPGPPPPGLARDAKSELRPEYTHVKDCAGLET